MAEALLVGIVSLTLSIAPGRAHGQLPEPAAGSICMPLGNYPVAGSADLVLRSPLCFSPPAPAARGGKAGLGRRVDRDSFSGTTVGGYTYGDAVHYCLERHMRLPSTDELKALVGYANGPEHPHGGYAIVASKDNKRYPGGVYGWGGQLAYWSSTFGGTRFHHVVWLTDGRDAPYHDSHRAYISCVR
ncbi:hypothetical protein D7S89_25515 [Trinickia fusca]|uniref:DUF1566 domain-containing protein n=1 Tax=Trinickia fusca TaxID=2419777 RepID=A0A494WZR8_9BURK|nr:hypothetical protein D7S89_25515 [Trinickia fusca]